ncbi:pre-rRNA processing protein [Malassezia vespertilionis]|uniref:pre-rRNA processing protein n=1 Tax=Malassezia vespertilionis TaxID=2020962 RepID=UPI0024B086D1|nr:pre-rRNA processing protein [Malassezia vespertilionis]WFD08621.1 pre-rRNA processing protein [Malassezia vespertilionis]
MSDPFFQKKRKRSGDARSASSVKLRKRVDDVDEEPLESVEDMDLRHEYTQDVDSDEEANARETPAETKIRLARLYLEGFHDKEEELVDGADAAVADRENITARLQRDVDEGGGKMHIRIASRLAAPLENDILATRGHRMSVTSVCSNVAADSFFSADKEGRIVQWRLRDGRQVCIFPRRIEHTDIGWMPSATSGAARRRARAGQKTKTMQGIVHLEKEQGHTADIYALALSFDGKHLVSGGRDRKIGVWRVETRQKEPDASNTTHFVKFLLGHKDAIRALAFRGTTSELFSASYDRTVKLFDVAQLSYIETLFGHQESIQDLSCLRSDRAVTAGGRERTCRLWKIHDESQLVFRGGAKSKVHMLLEGGDLVDTPSRKNEVHEGSMDCVAMIDDHHFLSGSDGGMISLWSIAKKKPVFTMPLAHGYEVHTDDDGVSKTLPRYITSLSCLPYGDVFASGSWDGSIRVWALHEQLRSFAPLFTIPAEGVVNSLQLITPSIERGSEYPVHPARWRRRGGLHMPLAASGEEESGIRNQASRVSAIQNDPATGRILGHKESIAPLLLAGVGCEPKSHRWKHFPHAHTGTLVVPLWLCRDTS